VLTYLISECLACTLSCERSAGAALATVRRGVSSTEWPSVVGQDTWRQGRLHGQGLHHRCAVRHPPPRTCSEVHQHWLLVARGPLCRRR